MTLTEILIHTLEALIVGLVLIKLIQVRSLYLRSRPTKDGLNEPSKTDTPTYLAYEKSARRSNRDHLCLKDLPLPEVSFSHDDNTKQSEEKHQTHTQKCVLENYIDDFFAVETGLLYTNSNSDLEKDDDEFITIQKENAEMIRQIQVSTTTPTRLAS